MLRLLPLLAGLLFAQSDPFSLPPEPSAPRARPVPEAPAARTAVADSANFAELDVEPEEDGLRRRIARLAGPGEFPKRLPRYARRIMRDFFKMGDKERCEFGISVSSAAFRGDGALRYAYRVFYRNTADPRHSVNIPVKYRGEDLFNFHTHPPEDAGVPSYCPDQDKPVWGDLSVSRDADRDGMHSWVVGSKYIAGFSDGKVRAVYDARTGKRVGTNIRWKAWEPEGRCVVDKSREDAVVVE